MPRACSGALTGAPMLGAAGVPLRALPAPVLASSSRSRTIRSMDLIIGCFLASAALLGIGILERLTSGRTSQELPDSERGEAPMVMLVRNR